MSRLLLSTFAFFVLVSSCDRSHMCSCTYSKPGESGGSRALIDEMSRKEAEDLCEQRQNQLLETYTTANCVIE